MDVIGFLYVSLGSSTVQLHAVQVADAHVQVQRLVSVVKWRPCLRTVLPKRSVLVCILFCGQKDLMERIFIKKCFLFMVGSVCRVKRSQLYGKRFVDDEEVEWRYGSG
jgi:hypothetical protein